MHLVHIVQEVVDTHVRSQAEHGRQDRSLDSKMGELKKALDECKLLQLRRDPGLLDFDNVPRGK